ncbi:MAG: hypothetical protein ACI8TE_000970 [Francisella sp.]|jgi:hypothetical protein
MMGKKQQSKAEEEYRKMLVEFYKENSKFMEKFIPSTSIIIIGFFVSQIAMVQQMYCYNKVFFLFCILMYGLTIVLSMYTLIKSQKIINEVIESFDNTRFREIEVLEVCYRWCFIASLIVSYVFIIFLVVR